MTLSRGYMCLTAILFLLGACSSGNQKENSTKFKQYYIKGESLYIKHCSNCHQKDGAGLGLLFPPLNRSDYLTNNFESVICLQRHGIRGELVVNGKSFNKEMPPPMLSDLDIAMISTYIYNTWGNEKGLIDVTEASRILRSCEDR